MESEQQELKLVHFFPGWECKCKKITNYDVHTKKELAQLKKQGQLFEAGFR